MNDAGGRHAFPQTRIAMTISSQHRHPFGYYERFSGADVSLKPLADTAQRLARSASVEAASSAGSAGQASSAV
jgi:hypothetical protein